MGGQEEYRLIHQLFLHDTTVALVLLDPTRGATAFKEVETWNKYLDKQLRGRAAVKLLVGAKLDQPSDTIDRQGLERLCPECGFAGYYETSAFTGRGVAEFCEAVAKPLTGMASARPAARNSSSASATRSRPGASGARWCCTSPICTVRWAISRPREEEERAVNAVTEQLAAQGVIARSRVSTGEPVLVLQVQEIERYAGSLIVAARNNPRGVPALELRAIAQAGLLPAGHRRKERLPRSRKGRSWNAPCSSCWSMASVSSTRAC